MNELMTVEQSLAMPVMDMAMAVNRRNQFVGFVKEIMVKGIDYGEVPGTEKPTLLKPGAEKLSTFFGLSPSFELINSVEDWDRPLFHYQYKCKLFRGDRLVGEGIGSCNSRETKYRWRWVTEDDIPPYIDPKDCLTRKSSISEFKFAIDKAETGGKYGKPQQYWDEFKAAITAGDAIRMNKKTKSGVEYEAYQIDTTVYRIPNEEVFSLLNTIDKMAQKRALVAAVLIGVNASEFFTQDLEDMDGFIVDQQPIIKDVTPSETKDTTPSPAPVSTNDLPQNKAQFWAAVTKQVGSKAYANMTALFTAIGGEPDWTMVDNVKAALNRAIDTAQQPQQGDEIPF